MHRILHHRRRRQRSEHGLAPCATSQGERARDGAVLLSWKSLTPGPEPRGSRAAWSAISTSRRHVANFSIECQFEPVRTCRREVEIATTPHAIRGSGPVSDFPDNNTAPIAAPFLLETSRSAGRAQTVDPPPMMQYSMHSGRFMMGEIDGFMQHSEV